MLAVLAAALTVFAASSLREAFLSLGHLFQQQHPGAEIELNFAGSQDLRVQIENGARADVFASADQRHMDALRRESLAREPRIFARNQPVLVAPAANPAHLRTFADLPRAQRVVLGAKEVPIGEYSEQILDHAGPGFRAQVLQHVVSRELNVRQVLAKVSLGEADAAIVYRTDAAAAAGKVIAIDIPDAPVAEYPIAALTDAPLAKEFIALVLSPAGHAVLAKFGFR